MALAPDMNERIHRYISEQVSANGYPPSLEEIGAHVGLASKSTVHRRLQALVEEGKIEARRFRGTYAYFPVEQA